MKNKSFLMLSVIALLALGACNGGNKSNEPKSEEPVPSSEEPGIDPVVELDDIEEATMEIEFDEIEDTCMINPKAKTYIDAMEELVNLYEATGDAVNAAKYRNKIGIINRNLEEEKADMLN